MMPEVYAALAIRDAEGSFAGGHTKIDPSTREREISLGYLSVLSRDIGADAARMAAEAYCQSIEFPVSDLLFCGEVNTEEGDKFYVFYLETPQVHPSQAGLPGWNPKQSDWLHLWYIRKFRDSLVEPWLTFWNSFGAGSQPVPWIQKGSI